MNTNDNSFIMLPQSLQDKAPLDVASAHALLKQLLDRALIDPQPLDADGVMLYGDTVV